MSASLVPSSVSACSTAVVVVPMDDAFRQPQLEKQLGPLRKREELLLHVAERDHRDGEDADGRSDRGDPPAHAGADQPAQDAVAARRVERALAVGRLGMGADGLRQQHDAEVGREDDGHEPGGDQGDRHHVEDAAGIFADRRRARSPPG